MAYSANDINRLKQLIAQHLEQNNILDTLKEILERETISEALQNDKILNTLQQHGLVDQVLSTLKPQEIKQQEQTIQEQQILQENKKFLHLNVKQGKAFIDFMESDQDSTLQIDIYWNDQKFRLSGIQCAVEPVINKEVYIDFGKIDLYSLLKINSPIHLIVSQVNSIDRQLLSSKKIEWRPILSAGSLSFPIELQGVGPKQNLTVGILHMEVTLLPRISSKVQLLSQSEVNKQIQYERKKETDELHAFFQQSSLWWQDYKQIRPNHEKRLIKIYAEQEDNSYAPVTSLIVPLLSNLIPTPNHAARFVSLIPFSRTEAPGGGRSEVWHLLPTFLSVKHGDVEDHATLLCCLLLGFGLDAYVAVGTSPEGGSHIWVITIADSVYHWEPVTGQKLACDDPKVHKYYRTISCLFNHRMFYGNVQVDDTVINCIWQLENQSMWKPLLSIPIKYSKEISLSQSQIYSEVDIEKQIKEYIKKLRASIGLLTNFDDKLSHMLTPALHNYEIDRLANITFGNEEFQSAIKRYIPEGHTFKGYPCQNNHVNPEKIFANVQQSQIGMDILQVRGDQVFFAVRCQVHTYPNDVYAIWTMIAVRFRSI